MMRDVIALHRGSYHRISAAYYIMVTTIRILDKRCNPTAYDVKTFDDIISVGKLNCK